MSDKPHTGYLSDTDKAQPVKEEMDGEPENRTEADPKKPEMDGEDENTSEPMRDKHAPQE